jgi:hypothetical protein
MVRRCGGPPWPASSRTGNSIPWKQFHSSPVRTPCLPHPGATTRQTPNTNPAPCAVARPAARMDSRSLVRRIEESKVRARDAGARRTDARATSDGSSRAKDQWLEHVFQPPRSTQPSQPTRAARGNQRRAYRKVGARGQDMVVTAVESSPTHALPRHEGLVETPNLWFVPPSAARRTHPVLEPSGGPHARSVARNCSYSAGAEGKAIGMCLILL